MLRLIVYGNYIRILFRKGIVFGAINSKDKGIAYFDLKDLRQEPYYYPIIYALHEAGYKILIANHPLFIGHIFGPGKYIYDLNNLKVCLGKIASPKFYITDDQRNRNEVKAHHSVYLDLKFLETKNLSLLPYPLHPDIYHKRLYLDNLKLREKERKCRIVFSGNIEPLAYQSRALKKHFAGLNRVQIIDAILRHFNKEVLHVNTSINKNSNKEQTYFKGIVINAWKWSTDYNENMDVKISIHEWLPFLASADFFIACPGISIPFSHNAIEAMSVGTIPILNYSDSFSPGLENGKNCISFSDEADLIRKLETIFSMKSEEILQLRTNVIEYYENHLNYLSVIPRLFTENKQLKEYIFINEVV